MERFERMKTMLKYNLCLNMKTWTRQANSMFELNCGNETFERKQQKKTFVKENCNCKRGKRNE